MHRLGGIFESLYTSSMYILSVFFSLKARHHCYTCFDFLLLQPTAHPNKPKTHTRSIVSNVLGENRWHRCANIPHSVFCMSTSKIKNFPKFVRGHLELACINSCWAKGSANCSLICWPHGWLGNKILTSSLFRIQQHVYAMTRMLLLVGVTDKIEGSANCSLLKATQMFGHKYNIIPLISPLTKTACTSD